MRLFIDSEGELVAESDISAAAGVVTLSGEALVRYLVANMGWIEIAVSQYGIKVRARPRILSQASMAALFFALHDAAAPSIYLKILTKDWMVHRFEKISNAMSLLSELHTSPQAPHWLGHDRLLRTSVPADKTRFGGILKQAILVGHNVDDPSRVVEILNRLLPVRWSVCEQNPNEGTTIVSVHNGKYLISNQRSNSSTVLSDNIDPGFVRWVSEFHNKILTSMMPRTDLVDIVARFSTVGEMRVRYEAITIPIARRDGSRALICGAADNSAIDLRKPLDHVA